MYLIFVEQKQTIMTTKQTLREEWRALNLKINSALKTTKQNTTAGYQPSEEYMNWIKSLMNRRDELTPLV